MCMIKYISVDLVLNKLCNMNCSYCGSHSNTIDDVLDESIYKTWVNRIHDKYPDFKINFILLGGELSLLPKNYLYNTVKWLSGKDYCGKIHIYTNCKVYSNEIHRCLTEFKSTHLRVSCDTVDQSINSRPISADNIINTLTKYDINEKVIIDSTLNNLTIEGYPDMQKIFIDNGINKFKFKYERFDALSLINLSRNNYIGSLDNIINKFISVIRKDCLYVNNFNLNTVVISELHERVDFSIHLVETNNRTNRNIFGKIDIPKELLWNAYE